MDTVWAGGPQTVRAVHQALPAAHRVAYTTVMTVMNRLVDQGYLRRRGSGHGPFRYQAVQSRAAHSASATKRNIDLLVRRYGDVALAQFMEKLDRVPEEKLQKLRRQLRPDT